ncbi:hypothetical protein [Pseudokordiimonas caeni]|uniref:hypothetical protein n=1 Tax=Pseudokordiimonas caeni TaxID=2997908 RepID=UPI002812618D|nr:hypothetical protein [Pseudokordiimonas caeni]
MKRFALLLTVFLIFSCSDKSGNPQYIMDVMPDGSDFWYISCSPRSINDSGVVVGNVTLDDGTKAGRLVPFIWRRPGFPVLLRSPLDWETRDATPVKLRPPLATRINTKGQILGSTYDANNRHHGVEWDSRGRLHLLPRSIANAVGLEFNDNGQIAGAIRASDNSLSAFLWDIRSQMTPIPGIEQDPWVLPGAMNNLGTVVLESRSELGTQLFLWDKKNGSRPIGKRRQSSIHPTAINDNGALVAIGKTLRDDDASGGYGLKFEPGADDLQLLPLPQKVTDPRIVGDKGKSSFSYDGPQRFRGTHPSGINNSGEIVGTSIVTTKGVANGQKNTSEVRIGLYWRADGSVVSVNDLVPDGQRYIPTGATDINERGEILGQASLPGKKSENRCFVLSPSPK